MARTRPATASIAAGQPRLAIILGWAGVIVGAVYLLWRIGWTVNTDALWLSLPLLLAEISGYVTFLLFFFMSWDIRPLPTAPPPRDVTVDLYVPTYNEPYEVLALTVAGAVAVRYPHETYVLDDGRRPWVAKLCKDFGVRYITRPDNSGAKAGNLNHALGITAGEFIAIVDADFVPAPGFIDDLLGYFTDPAVAIVQGPQQFYNTNSFQHADAEEDDWHEQLLFYEVIQPGKNRHNAAFWSGSPSLVRRAAIEAVGGVHTETVTEDLHTSLKLHEAGWKTVYHPGVVALGLAPDDFDAFIVQRLRWAQGAMQVIRREWRTRRLSLAQRLNYIASTTTYFDAYRKALMLMIVPAMLITDQLPISANVAVFAAMWTSQFAVLTAANAALGRGHYRPFYTELFDLMKMFAFISAGPTLLSSKPIRFKVTPKGEPGERRLHAFLMPFCLLLGLYIASTIVGIIRLGGWGLTTGNQTAMLGAVVWGVGLTAMFAVVTVRGFRHVTRRRAFRIPVALPARYHQAGQAGVGTVCTLTLLGLSLETAGPIASARELTVTLLQPTITLHGDVRAVTADSDGEIVGVSLPPDQSARVPLASLLARLLFAPPAGATEDEHLAPVTQPVEVA